MAAEQAAIRMAVQEVVNAVLPNAMTATMTTVQASLDQLMAGMQTTANRIDVAEAAITKVGNAVEEITSNWAQRLDDIEGEMATLNAEVRGTANDVEAEKRALLTKLDAEFKNSKIMLDDIVKAARGGFDGVKSTMQDLHLKTANAFQQVKAKVDDMEGASGTADNGLRGRWRGFIPAKNMVPNKYDNAEEKWRTWQDDVMDYLDAMKPGMRKMLKAVEAKDGNVTDEWLASMIEYHPEEVVGDGEHVWMALKQLTEGEARKVVMSTRAGDG